MMTTEILINIINELKNHNDTDTDIKNEMNMLIHNVELTLDNINYIKSNKKAYLCDKKINNYIYEIFSPYMIILKSFINSEVNNNTIKFDKNFIINVLHKYINTYEC